MAKYTVSQMVQMQATALRLRLDGWERFCSADPEYLCRVCNGIGPEWFPEKYRRALDSMHASMEVPAAIHDHDYDQGTGTAPDFRRANERLARNGVLCADDRYGWYNPVRYIARSKAREFGALCQAFGRKAYEAAIAARKARDRETVWMDGRDA